ncbi:MULTISPECIES: urea ABC transporter permease subunit UrtB [Rhodomicrobium]|uniref:urea ABC transporter permease subunit UrtB n=1 Tax=Rhodomicrobium TaxID=1068 RepID=UPI000B4BFA6C|nr:MULTISPECIES: urea ABC transporter permease subunit UrtB [Rhodomicrobium]
MKRAAFLLLLALAVLVPRPSFAQDIEAAINALGQGSFNERTSAANALAQTGDQRAVPVLKALGDRELYLRKADNKVFIGRTVSGTVTLIDPVTGKEAGVSTGGDIEGVKVNNALRRTIEALLGGLTLLSSDPAVRRDAATAMFNQPDPEALGTLDAAIAKETDPAIKAKMDEARAAAVLKSSRPDAEKIAAVKILGARGDQASLSLLQNLEASAQGDLKAAAAEAIEDVSGALALWNNVQNLWYGISLGSVLLLAAIGLAITFGVMGVINMAHGEMVMIGAYTTFFVQELFRAHAPEAFDYSLFVALPAAFAVAGLVGIAMERGIIRFLYGRPLETLLATWGISLMLQQTVRSLFGPSNREVGTPSWMSGTVEITNGLTLTSNRIAIVVFTAIVFIALMLVMRFTRFGLQMRAVTQNRPMANSVGIRSGWVDAMTFGLGSAIAGVAGVALSQIDNVSPNLGQSYIIDSFLVVVFGGVGNLWGTLVGAMSLGILNKFLEPWAGAVLGKILILVMVILFIQRRPRGLFALKGRSVEA